MANKKKHTLMTYPFADNPSEADLIVSPIEYAKPVDLNDAIEYYLNFITSLHKSYIKLIYLKSKLIDSEENMHCEEFEHDIKNIFSIDYFGGELFVSYIRRIVLVEEDENKLKKYYQSILVRLQECKGYSTIINSNFKYYHYESLLTPINPALLNFIYSISWEEDENHDFINTEKEYFTTDEFHEGIILELETTEKRINEIFSIKELNRIDSNYLKSNPPNKDITPIWWKKSDRLLGYLLEELAKAGFINSDTNINQIIKQHFINQHKNPFSDSIKQNRSGTSNNKGTSNQKESKPKGHTEIDMFINNLKKP